MFIGVFSKYDTSNGEILYLYIGTSCRRLRRKRRTAYCLRASASSGWQGSARESLHGVSRRGWPASVGARSHTDPWCGAGRYARRRECSGARPAGSAPLPGGAWTVTVRPQGSVHSMGDGVETGHPRSPSSGPILGLTLATRSSVTTIGAWQGHRMSGTEGSPSPRSSGRTTTGGVTCLGRRDRCGLGPPPH